MRLTTYAAALGRGSTPSVWPNAPREPLPPDPAITAEPPGQPEASCWAAEPYDRVLPAGIPATPDRRFHRGNVIGVRVPGLVQGVFPLDRSLDSTWSWTEYTDAQMRLACDWHVDGCGYTHVSLSIPQTWNYGKTIDDLARVMRYAHSRGMFVSLNVGSDGRPFSDFQSALDQLVAMGALIPGRDVLCAVWQIDKWYTPVDGIQCIKDVAAWDVAHDFLHFVHWGGGYAGWAENCAMWDPDTAVLWDIYDRFSFQHELRHDLDGHYGQCNTESDLGQVQSWIRKIVVAFPPGMSFVAAEMDMQAEADDPMHRLERYGDAKTFYAQCTTPNYGVQISSFNGSRGRDGRVLLPE